MLATLAHLDPHPERRALKCPCAHRRHGRWPPAAEWIRCNVRSDWPQLASHAPLAGADSRLVARLSPARPRDVLRWLEPISKSSMAKRLCSPRANPDVEADQQLLRDAGPAAQRRDALKLGTQFFAAQKAANVVSGGAGKLEARPAACEGQVCEAASWNSQRKVGKLATAAQRANGRDPKSGEQRDPDSHADQCGQSARARPAPSEVATPLPAAPFRNIEKTCPSTANQPRSRWQPGARRVGCEYNRKGALPASTRAPGRPNPTEGAADMVVPMLPLPTLRRSTPGGAAKHDAGGERSLARRRRPETGCAWATIVAPTRPMPGKKGRLPE